MTGEIARKGVQSFRRNHSETQPADREILTPREEDILEGLASRRVNKETADRLSLCYDTVRYHLKRIYVLNYLRISSTPQVFEVIDRKCIAGGALQYL